MTPYSTPDLHHALQHNPLWRPSPRNVILLKEPQQTESSPVVPSVVAKVALGTGPLKSFSLACSFTFISPCLKLPLEGITVLSSSLALFPLDKFWYFSTGYFFHKHRSVSLGGVVLSLSSFKILKTHLYILSSLASLYTVNFSLL